MHPFRNIVNVGLAGRKSSKGPMAALPTRSRRHPWPERRGKVHAPRIKAAGTQNPTGVVTRRDAVKGRRPHPDRTRHP